MDVPLTTMKVKEGGPRENGRVWLSPEGMLSIAAAPGSHCLLSIPSQEMEVGEELSSKIIPSPSDTDPYGICLKRNLREAWGVTGGAGMGAYYIGCEVWPNGRLKKGEMQISQCIHHHVHQPMEGSMICILRLDYCIFKTHLSQSQHALDRSIDQIPNIQTKKNQISNIAPPVCRSVSLCVVQCLQKDGGEDEWLERTLKDGNALQMEILKASIRHQLHRRLLLIDNIVSLPVLGSTMLLSVDQMIVDDGSVTMALIDGDHVEIELTAEARGDCESGFLERTRAAIEAHDEGSRNEAAIDSALCAARSGLQALERFSVDQCILSDVVRSTLHTSVVLPLVSPSIFASSGLNPPRGLILHGSPGSGKTIAAIWAAKTAKANLFVIDGPSLLSEYYGTAEASLSAIFSAAKKLSPSLIFFDEIDSVVVSRGSSSTHEASIRLVTTLLTQFDNLEGYRVVVIGATNRLEVIDDALRRPGRFDRELELAVPDPALRSALLSVLSRDTCHSLTDEAFADLAFDAHGYLPADLSAVCREASLVALRRHIAEGGAELSVSVSDFRKALSFIRPSGLREWQIQVPRVRWQDVGGLNDVKQQLRESVEWPLHRASALEHLKTSAPRGILLFGPPGCSKTMLAESVATETKMNFVAVIGSELLSMFVGESEKAIARLFARAQQMAPCIVFFDEIDGLLSHRDEGDHGTALGQRVMSQMLSEMDGIRDRGNVIVIGATNKPQLIDPAMLRPGRFDRLIFVPPPDFEARKAIFEIQTKQMSTAEDVDIEKLASETEDYIGADLATICREAGICALEENIEATHIHLRHFLEAIETSSPSLDGQEECQMEIYRSFRRGGNMGSAHEK